MINSDTEQFGSLKLLGRVSLWFSVVALIGFVAVMLMSGSERGRYLETIHSLSVMQQQLPWIVLSGGLLLVIGTGVTTWLITLYSSFRVAGPLHRFSRNLEAGIREGEVGTLRIRSDDYLQDESRLLEQTVTGLYGHYAKLDGLVDEALAELGSAEPVDVGKLDEVMAQLNAMEQRVQYDDH
jgi:hypothetical protein